jgi:aminopeptidase N
MNELKDQKIYLKDYQVPNYLVDQVELVFKLSEEKTRVVAKVLFRANPEATDSKFYLDGVDLDLQWAKIDGKKIDPLVNSTGLSFNVNKKEFIWECEVIINPKNNTALEGLYISNGMYCTQCEAEGFRKITYYPDRPDVMAEFFVRIEGDKDTLLSNGNPTDQGKGWIEWHDPWPKPSYLFALVAGDLISVTDTFKTKSGRNVELNIYVRSGDEDKCAFSMSALKTSMKWDEENYGREYDLDLFNIVAVDDFNMGAMENKGLNIFNSSYVLAKPETTTDDNFEAVEAVIAHEYFHNWTGNRITCRDWFQLCLKEGLTVFRDAEFTADQRSSAVKRIKDVILLKSRQFREDGGPLAHPVRPESFVEINNFYTLTVYEKGAELVSMIKRLVGDKAYRKALDLYFETYDGQAVTIEDWIKVFEDVTKLDLSQFILWYQQAGTPILSVAERWENNFLQLSFRQEIPDTPGQCNKKPHLIPVDMSLLDKNSGEIIHSENLKLNQKKEEFIFGPYNERPVPSLLRNFSAPVILKQKVEKERLAFIFEYDTDSFNRWDAGRKLCENSLFSMISESALPDNLYLNSLRKLIRDDTLDPAFRALTLSLPSQDEITQKCLDNGVIPDPMAIYRSIETLSLTISDHLKPDFEDIYKNYTINEDYKADATQSAYRALRNRALSFLAYQDGAFLAKIQAADAQNMTDQLSAFSTVIKHNPSSEHVKLFYDQWKHERLVIDKWFSAQVLTAHPNSLNKVVHNLTTHSDFSITTPNRVRSILGAFSANTAGFHLETGDNYKLFSDWILKVDPVNPQVAARMCSAFETWKRYDPKRQSLIKSQINKILDAKSVSKDTREMLSRLII